MYHYTYQARNKTQEKWKCLFVNASKKRKHVFVASYNFLFVFQILPSHQIRLLPRKNLMVANYLAANIFVYFVIRYQFVPWHCVHFWLLDNSHNHFPNPVLNTHLVKHGVLNVRTYMQTQPNKNQHLVRA